MFSSRQHTSSSSRRLRTDSSLASMSSPTENDEQIPADFNHCVQKLLSSIATLSKHLAVLAARKQSADADADLTSKLQVSHSIGLSAHGSSSSSSATLSCTGLRLQSSSLLHKLGINRNLSHPRDILPAGARVCVQYSCRGESVRCFHSRATRPPLEQPFGEKFDHRRHYPLSIKHSASLSVEKEGEGKFSISFHLG